MNSSYDHDAPTGELYTLETVEQITHISRDRILVYHRYGLVRAVPSPQENDIRFDDEAIHRLRRLARMMAEYGVNEQGLRLMSSLMDEVERLRDEVRFLRG